MLRIRHRKTLTVDPRMICMRVWKRSEEFIRSPIDVRVNFGVLLLHQWIWSCSIEGLKSAFMKNYKSEKKYKRVRTSITVTISSCSLLAPSMQERNRLTGRDGMNSSLKGSRREGERNAYSFMTASVSPPKYSMYSPVKCVVEWCGKR